MTELRKLYDAIRGGAAKTAVAVTREELGENTDPMELIHRYMAPPWTRWSVCPM